jgi:hypothetical protein
MTTNALYVKLKGNLYATFCGLVPLPLMCGVQAQEISRNVPWGGGDDFLQVAEFMQQTCEIEDFLRFYTEPKR